MPLAITGIDSACLELPIVAQAVAQGCRCGRAREEGGQRTLALCRARAGHSDALDGADLCPVCKARVGAFLLAQESMHNQ